MTQAVFAKLYTYDVGGTRLITNNPDNAPAGAVLVKTNGEEELATDSVPQPSAEPAPVIPNPSDIRVERDPKDFTDANLDNANNRGAMLDGFIFKGASLNSANFEGASMKGISFEGAQLESANMSGANLENANLKLAWMKNARLSNANLERALLDSTNFTRANLSGAKMAGSFIVQANFMRADLKGVDLRGAEFKTTEANRVVNFMMADLSGANFQDAKVLGILYLDYANLCGANFKNVALDSVKLRGARFDEYTFLPFSYDDALLKGMVYEGKTRLSKVTFKEKVKELYNSFFK